MKKTITPANFNRMLEWLNPDREQAGVKLEKIRRRLSEMLASRGCYEADYWADETIDRVVLKIDEVVKNYEGDPAYYFYGVSKKMYLECMKKRPPSYVPPAPTPPDDVEREYAHLEACLARLTEADRDLILRYYGKEGREKIQNRNVLAQELGIGLNALRIRVYRIRITLKDYIRDCFAQETSVEMYSGTKDIRVEGSSAMEGD